MWGRGASKVTTYLLPMNTEHPQSDEPVVLKLSPARALVLFDFLWRFSQTNQLEIRDRAEARVLWDLGCDLEKMLAEPFAPNGAELLQKARDAVRDSVE